MGTTLEMVRPDLPRLTGPVPGPRARAIVERDERVVSPSYTRCYPLVASRGEGAVVEDVDGNRFLDFSAGIAVVATGHCHPRVVKAVQQQAARLIHMSGTDFYYENLVQLAEKLAETAPGDVPRRVSFCNSGAEAMEGAIKLARYSTGRDKFIAFLGGFHGRTLGALSLTARKAVQRKGFADEHVAQGAVRIDEHFFRLLGREAGCAARRGRGHIDWRHGWRGAAKEHPAAYRRPVLHIHAGGRRGSGAGGLFLRGRVLRWIFPAAREQQSEQDRCPSHARLLCSSVSASVTSPQ